MPFLSFSAPASCVESGLPEAGHSPEAEVPFGRVHPNSLSASSFFVFLEFVVLPAGIVDIFF